MSKATGTYVAIQQRQAERAAAHPVRSLFTSLGLKLVGVAMAVGGWEVVRPSLPRVVKDTAIPADVPGLILGGLMWLVAAYVLARGPTEAVLAMVLDRLPFLKRKEAP